MFTITMTSPTVAGEIILTYNEKNRLSSLLITEALTDGQYKRLIGSMPWNYEMLTEFSAANPTATFVHQALKVSFDMFWNRYNDKERSSKKKTETAWNKMPVAEQIKAFRFIAAYNQRRGTADKKYATTYLSDELWNN